jgi:hypothetical protein
MLRTSVARVGFPCDNGCSKILGLRRFRSAADAGFFGIRWTRGLDGRVVNGALVVANRAASRRRVLIRLAARAACVTGVRRGPGAGLLADIEFIPFALP